MNRRAKLMFFLATTRTAASKAACLRILDVFLLASALFAFPASAQQCPDPPPDPYSDRCRSISRSDGSWGIIVCDQE
jgi:hypothetical protein